MHQITHRDRLPFIYLREVYQNNLEPPHPAWPPDVRAVACYVHAHLFRDTLTVEQIKKQCGIGNNNISGRFRHYIGMGIKEYIDAHRIALAKRMLCQRHLSILSVALEVGYPSHSAFTKGFRHHVGCAPSVYRGHVEEKRQEIVEEEGKERASKEDYY